MAASAATYPAAYWAGLVTVSENTYVLADSTILSGLRTFGGDALLGSAILVIRVRKVSHFCSNENFKNIIVIMYKTHFLRLKLLIILKWVVVGLKSSFVSQKWQINIKRALLAEILHRILGNFRI